MAATEPMKNEENTANKVQPRSPHRRALLKFSNVKVMMPKGLPTKL